MPYEYMKINYSGGDLTELNNLADAGWRLISVIVPLGIHGFMILEREQVQISKQEAHKEKTHHARTFRDTVAHIMSKD